MLFKRWGLLSILPLLTSFTDALKGFTMVHRLLVSLMLTFTVFSCTHSADRKLSSEMPGSSECQEGFHVNSSGTCIKSSTTPGPGRAGSRNL